MLNHFFTPIELRELKGKLSFKVLKYTLGILLIFLLYEWLFPEDWIGLGFLILIVLLFVGLIALVAFIVYVVLLKIKSQK